MLLPYSVQRMYYSGVDDLIDWLQDRRLAQRLEARPLIEALEDLDDSVRAGGNGELHLDLSALHQAAGSDNNEIRKIATLALARFGDEEAGRQVTLLLGDESPIVRQAAVESAAGKARPADTAALIAILGNREEENEVRQAAILALAQVRLPEAVQALAAALDDAAPEIRRLSARSLAAIGSVDGIETAVGKLRDLLDDPAPGVCAAAAEALAKLDDGQARSSAEDQAEPPAAVDAAGPATDRQTEESAEAPAHKPATDAAGGGKTRESAVSERFDLLAKIDRTASDLQCETEECEGGRILKVVVGRNVQPVIVTGGERDEDGAEVVRIRAVCGPADSGNYRNALLLNRHLLFGAMSVREERPGETFELSEAMPARDVTVENLRKIVSYIASAADQIARQLEGE